MSARTTDVKRDIPVPAALALLAAIAFLLLAGKDAPRLAAELQGLSNVVEANLLYLTVVLASGSLTAAWIAAKYRRAVKLTKQGSRLESLLGNRKPGDGGLLRRVAMASFAAAAAFLFFLLLPTDGGDQFRLTPFQSDVWGVVEILAAITMASAAATGAFVFPTGKLRIFGKTAAAQSALPEVPSEVNSVVIGTTDEGDSVNPPRWVSLDRRALNGNILITGSIGGGKTQGTILPYFDQILERFDPKPSVLAIDPKGTFIAEAKKIAEVRGLKDQCLHLCLQGDVAFNPIYHPDALRDSRFLDIAYMVKAAATNFMGRSADSAFWEMSSFNLIKNSLVYCAAVYKYYTLTDLYDVMLRAVENELPEKLKLSVETKKGKRRKFDDEQTFNIMRSYDYFALEFRQLEEKVRSGILATATSFLNQFQEYQASRIFCPKQKQSQIRSLDEVVDGGKILLFDIASPALAKSMGTIVKLLYQQSLLERLKGNGRDCLRPGVLIIDEYQDVVTTGYGASLGDERFLAKAREANTISIVSTQSLTSLQNSIGKEESAKELYQNFRTRIAGHSSDLATIRSFQELVGQEDKEKVSHSLSELSQDARKNYMLGGFEANNANISESVSKSTQREFVVTGKEFSSLSTFECFGIVYDGVKSTFQKLFLKPYFLSDKRTTHGDLLVRMSPVVPKALVGAALATMSAVGQGFPNICNVVKTEDFSSCMEFSVSTCMCGYPPHPCAQFNYYVPSSFIEVHPNPGETFFQGLPAAMSQLANLAATGIPFGAEADSDTQSFHAHTLSIPLASMVMNLLPCSVRTSELGCFEAMSEHLGPLWSTGAADQSQPNFLAWMANPKACLLMGAATSVTGGEMGAFSPGSPMCSVPVAGLQRFPPSAHSACNGWGVFYPRCGIYNGPSQTAGALMVASRMKSLASEVFQSTATTPGEKWQMITPQSSSCFREGENILPLETFKRATEYRRLAGAPTKGHLFAIWRRVSCCKELSEVPTSAAVLAAIQASCQAGGGL